MMTGRLCRLELVLKFVGCTTARLREYAMSARTAVQIVVLPVWRQHWAFASRVLEAEKQTSKGMLQRIGAWFWKRSEAQYERLKTAKPGSIRHYVRKIADRLADQVGPEEKFLGTLGQLKGGRVEVVYPSFLSQKLVRRRLRLVVRNEPVHRAWAFLWGLATPLLFPLIFSPFSNVPIIYTMWRYYGHGTAMHGAKFLNEAPLDLHPSKDLEDTLGSTKYDSSSIPNLDSSSIANAINWPHDQAHLLAEAFDHKVRWLRLKKIIEASR